MKMLVVDDDSMNRILISEILTKYGRCDMAHDGLVALDMVLKAVKRKEPYQLICLDIMLPKIHGVKVLKSIRELEENHMIPYDQKSKIIVITALNDKEFIGETMQLGCDAFVGKPIEEEVLLKAMNRINLISE